jgi:DNA-binding CsgD family transcriptional regulator
LCKGASKGVLNISLLSFGLPLSIWHDSGGIAGCLIYIAVYALADKAFVWLGNITFASVAMGLLCNAFVPQIPELAAPFAFLLGIGNTVGMINMYYIIGVVGKKYDSMRYLRLSIILIGICGGISGILLGNLITETNTFEISIAASLISAAVMLMFMMASPVMVQARYEKDWGKDSANTEIDHEQCHVFAKYQLSKRETEVCELLLKGYTLRQISAILEIAYSTVNTYCTSLYRKLGINSRTELLLLHKNYLDN